MSEPSSTPHVSPETSAQSISESAPQSPAQLPAAPVAQTPVPSVAPTPPSAPRPTSRRAADAASAAADPAFFDEANVSVSASRIVAYGTGFPLKDAQSVRFFIDAPHVRFAIPILIAGLLLGAYGIVVHGSPFIALGFMLVVVSYLTYKFQTMRHRLFLVRETGETEVLVGSNLPFMQRVKAALESVVPQK